MNRLVKQAVKLVMNFDLKARNKTSYRQDLSKYLLRKNNVVLSTTLINNVKNKAITDGERAREFDKGLVQDTAIV